MRPLIHISFLSFMLLSCKSDTQWKGQDPITKTSTVSIPIETQQKHVFDLGAGVYCSNQFDGARLNHIERTGEAALTALITPENTPINESPWYAFKIWAEKGQDISITLTYPEGYRHRYYPKLSHNGRHWEPLDSARYTEHDIDTENNEWGFPDSVTMRLSVGPDTLWVAAQELITSTHVDAWCAELVELPFVSRVEIGKSTFGKSMPGLHIGNASDSLIIALISRQHPPEVTGYHCLQAFVETLCADTEQARSFRSRYTIYVAPLMNPDGVDGGHWRHNAGGVDTNRDWEDFNQPEPAALKAFLAQRLQTSGGQLLIGIDFHSTWEDIFYLFSEGKKGAVPGLIDAMLKDIDKALPGYTPNINHGLIDTPRVSSSACFYYDFGAESFTYEIGDNTPRDFVRKKGQVSAEALMHRLPALKAD